MIADVVGKESQICPSVCFGRVVFFVWLFLKTITDNNCNISTTAIVKQGSFPTEDL